MIDACFSKNELMHSIEEALEILLTNTHKPTKTILVPIHQSLGMTLAKDITSTINIPPKDSSAMDGYAFNLADFDKQPLPISTKICAGDNSPRLVSSSAARIFTGGQIPLGANVVVMQEDCNENNNKVEIFNKPELNQHIRKRGDDIKKGEIVLKKGEKIRAQTIGLLSSLGLQKILVYQTLKVGIFTTGNEVINPGKAKKSTQIYNSNRGTLLGLLIDMGIPIIDLGIIKDDLNDTKNILKSASEKADVIISSGGVSVGQEDYIKDGLADLGQLIMHKVRMKPGKPIAFGKIKQTFFLGLPGNPVSVFAVFNLFVRPFLAKLMGDEYYSQVDYILCADFNWNKSGNRREYLRAKQYGNKVNIYPNQSSGVLSSVHWADGFAVVKEGETVKKGDKITFIPFSQWGKL